MAYGQPSLKKAIGVLKDSTTVGFAKVNSDKKGIDVAIVKATNHENVLPKEKHVKTILAALSSSKPRDVVGYCIHGLAKRLAKTHTWTVAMKTLIVLHRATREVDFSFCEELINYSRNRGLTHRISRFTDDSSESAWECSAWVRAYALYIEERLECLRILKCDIEADDLRLQDHSTPDLLEQLPALQQLLSRLISCQPEGAAKQNNLIKHGLTTVASESVRVHEVLRDGVLAFADKHTELQCHDAIRVLEVCRKAGKQAEGLSEFYEMCDNLGVGQDLNLKKIDPLPENFLAALEDHMKEATHIS